MNENQREVGILGCTEASLQLVASWNHVRVVVVIVEAPFDTGGFARGWRHEMANHMMRTGRLLH